MKWKSNEDEPTNWTVRKTMFYGFIMIVLGFLLGYFFHYI